MQIHYTKENLYKEIKHLRNYSGISFDDYPLDLQGRCLAFGNIKIGHAPFNTTGLRGVLCLADSGCENNVILLNDGNTIEEQNFYCGHELIHFSLHRNIGVRSFNCFEKVKPQQDPFIEWQANEGSAELLLPYELFIPELFASLSPKEDMRQMFGVRCSLADKFNVSERVVYTRIENLKYEIDQYQCGVKLGGIKLLSRNQQINRSIKIDSLNTQEDLALLEEAASTFGW